jgi:hypothetical protein
LAPPGALVGPAETTEPTEICQNPQKTFVKPTEPTEIE